MLIVGSAGMMCLLEIIKYDTKPILHPPTAADLVLYCPWDNPGELLSSMG